MLAYKIIAIFLNVFVNYFLFVATAEILNTTPYHRRYVLSAVLLNIYNTLCLFVSLPAFFERIFYIVISMLVAFLAFGFTRSSFCGILIYLFLNIGLWASVCGFGVGGFVSVLICVIALSFVYYLCNAKTYGRRGIVPVSLELYDRQISFLALKDTGNHLRDPVTGQSVLILGADISEALTGLTKSQLADPVNTLKHNKIPGLRLLPYSTIGCDNGLLLALKIESAQIGDKQGSCIVALAPEKINGNGKYQGLLGGNEF